MRTLLGTAAELIRETYATIDIRIRRAPPSLWIAWIAAVMLVLTGLYLATQIGGDTETADAGRPTIGQPIDGDATTTIDADEDRPDSHGPVADADGAVTSTITSELGAVPAGSSGDDDEGSDTTPSTSGDREPTGTTAPTSAPATTTTAPLPPDGDEEPQGLLGAILDLLSNGS
ncbi:MAG: hypothetical protein ACRD2C_12895 [Acidimicrobiales bacterium]